MLESILLVIFFLISIAIIGLVLIQNGKGADMGSSFGAGASATLFGSSGTGNFLTRTTSILGLLFFVISLVLANISSSGSKSPFSDLSQDQQTEQIASKKKEQLVQKEVQKKQENNSTFDIPE